MHAYEFALDLNYIQRKGFGNGEMEKKAYYVWFVFQPIDPTALLSDKGQMLIWASLIPYGSAEQQKYWTVFPTALENPAVR